MWTSLVGFMASGKSTVARRMQADTNRPTVSLDAEVEAMAGCTVAAIFAGQGEAAFRRLEIEALTRLDAARPLVVDTGGGLVQSPDALAFLRSRGVVIWLDAPWATVRARLAAAEEDAEAPQRPLVAELGWAGLEDLFHRRRRLYAAVADFRLGSDRNPAEVVAERVMLRSLQWERRPQESRR